MKIKRLLSTILTAVLMLSMFAAFPKDAFAEDTVSVVRSTATPTRVYYDIKVTVKVTEDADGWNDARIGINHMYKGGVTDTKEITGLKSSFDDKSEFSVEQSSWLFPTSVDVYTDFGGGASWRSFQADVTVYVNGVNVASKHISAKSTAFSSSKTTNTISIDDSKYPYPKKVYADGVPEVALLEDGSYVSQGFVSMVDQYGSSYESNDVQFSDAEGSDLGLLYPKRASKTVDGKKAEYFQYKIVLIMNREDDKKLDYVITIPTANSVHSVVKAGFSVQYKCQHKVDVVFDGKDYDTLTGVADQEITLDYPDLVSDGFDLEWSLEGGGLLDASNPDEPVYAFGSEDGTLTAKLVPYSFTVVFDGNGSTRGTMASKIQRVGTAYTLPGNTFTKTGYEFVEWNTSPDGSGDSYANKSSVQNLSTVKNDTVTLYAQWKVKTYTVTFVNKVTGERIKQTVEYEQDAEAPEIEPVPIDENNHSVFSRWNKEFTNIKSNITVTSVHVTEPHEFVDEGDEHYCSVCGYGKADAAMTASAIGNGRILVIAAASVLAVAAIVTVAVISKRKKNKPEIPSEGDTGDDQE